MQPTANHPVTTVYLIRHGQSEMNNRAQITGQLDVPLSPKGAAQAAALARLMAQVKLDAIYTSALVRSIETARGCALQQQLKPVALAALNEIHLGVLQGRHRDKRDPEAAALFAQWRADMWNVRVPGAETFDELRTRAQAALALMLERHAGGALLIVAHRGTNRVLLGTLLDLPRAEWPLLRPSNKIVHRIRMSDGRCLEHQELKLGKEENNYETATHVAA